MPVRPRWRCRASSLGYYFSCGYRAAFDRALAEGLMELEAEAAAEVEANRRSSPQADFGTCTHFHLQDGLRCQFPGPPADYAPEPEQRTNAARMWNGSAEECDAQIRTCATLAARHMPATPDGRPWLAESEWEWGRYLQGHIDFLSPCYKQIIDLKTTGRPPPGNKVKPAHLIQLIGYRQMVGLKTGVYPTKGIVLYVSSRSDWVLPVNVDFTTEPMEEFVVHVMNYLKYLRSPNLFKFAVPNPGDHCSDEWCPYKTACKNRIIPPPGTMAGISHDAPTMNFQGLVQ